MAFINNGSQRTLNLSISKTGNDGSISDPYLELDGKDAFGLYTLITTDEMQKLSDYGFSSRVAAWKSYLQTTYAESDPDLWGDISDSFKYVYGVIVRLVTPTSKQYQLTTYPVMVSESISLTIEDPYENDMYTMTIPGGSNTSNIISLKVASTSTDQDIETTNATVLATDSFGTYLHYQNASDLGNGGPILYPIPPVITMIIDPATYTSLNYGELSMDINFTGDEVFDQGCDYGVCYSTTVSNPTISGSHSTDGYGGTPAIATISGLIDFQTYNLVPYVTTGGATYYGTKTTVLFN